MRDRYECNVFVLDVDALSTTRELGRFRLHGKLHFEVNPLHCSALPELRTVADRGYLAKHIYILDYFLNAERNGEPVWPSGKALGW